MTLHNIIDNFRFNPTTITAMRLAREVAKYPDVMRHIPEHTKQRAVNCLRQSSDPLHHRFTSYLK